VGKLTQAFTLPQTSPATPGQLTEPRDERMPTADLARGQCRSRLACDALHALTPRRRCCVRRNAAASDTGRGGMGGGGASRRVSFLRVSCPQFCQRERGEALEMHLSSRSGI
jgi:hypothetical protein